VTGLLDRVSNTLNPNCLVKSGLKKDGCKVMMAGAPSPRLVVDFDRPGSPLEADGTRCDCLLIAEGHLGSGWVVLLELKKGQLHARKVTRQLQAGASVAERLVSGGEAVRFRPVAVSGSVSKYERQRLKEDANRIRFHGQTEPVRLMTCGKKLTDVLR